MPPTRRYEAEEQGHGRPDRQLWLRTRFPDEAQVAKVFAVAAFFCYGWTLIAFFRSLTVNWMLFMEPGEIVGVLSYLLVSDFFEAALVTSVLALLAALLPRQVLRTRFAARGPILVASLLGSIMLYMRFFEIRELDTSGFRWLLMFMGIGLPLVALVRLSSKVERFIVLAADRCVVLLYLFLPLSAAGLLIVVVRNLT